MKRLDYRRWVLEGWEHQPPCIELRYFSVLPLHIRLEGITKFWIDAPLPVKAVANHEQVNMFWSNLFRAAAFMELVIAFYKA